MAKKYKKSSPSSKRKSVTKTRTAKNTSRSRSTASKGGRKRTPVKKAGKRNTGYTQKTKKITKKVVKKPAKRSSRSYKEDYNKDLAKILKSLVKDVKGLKEQAAGKQPKPGPRKGKEEAFPLEEDLLSQKLPSTQKEALEMIASMRREMNTRNIKLDELMESPGKLYFTD